jgi:hypothetical protein
MKGMEAVAASQASGIENESAQAPATGQPNNKFRKAARNPRLDWALPIDGVGPIVPILPILPTAPRVRNKGKRRREIVALAPADVDMLRQLHERCESVGMHIRKPRLLAAGLHLLASMPMGKFLAVLGPLESPVTVQKNKKKKPPSQA